MSESCISRTAVVDKSTDPALTSNKDQLTSESDQSNNVCGKNVSDNTSHDAALKRLSKTERKLKKYENKVAWKKSQRKRKKEERKRKLTGETNMTDRSDLNVSKKQRLQLIKQRCQEALKTGQRVAIDLGMENRMSKKECSKLAQQLGRLYGSNRQSEKPLHVYLTGLKKDGFLFQECCRKNQGFENYQVDLCESSHLDLFQPDEIVYLSPDSADVLKSLQKDKVYIIGGLVDETIQKGVTVGQAEVTHIQTARLPIEEYMEKLEHGASSKVLTVNQVFDILKVFSATEDWRIALTAGVPHRKGYRLKPRDLN